MTVQVAVVTASAQRYAGVSTPIAWCEACFAGHVFEFDTVGDTLPPICPRCNGTMMIVVMPSRKAAKRAVSRRRQRVCSTCGGQREPERRWRFSCGACSTRERHAQAE